MPCNRRTVGLDRSSKVMSSFFMLVVYQTWILSLASSLDRTYGIFGELTLGEGGDVGEISIIKIGGTL